MFVVWLVNLFNRDFLGALQVSSDLSIVDLDVPFGLIFVVASTVNTGCSLGVLAIVTWQVLFVSIPMVYLAFRLQVSFFFFFLTFS